jgi:Ca-activated chloride channel family protein
MCGMLRGQSELSIASRGVPPRTWGFGNLPIRQDVRLVLVPVTVTSGNGRPLDNLRKQDFRLFEDNVEQRITYFGSEDGPVSVAIVLDLSSSMRRKLADAREAVAQFMKNTAWHDEYMLVTFNDRPAITCGFTENAGRIERLVGSARPEGWTALWDAIYLGLHSIEHATYRRRALLVVTDGGDNHSRYTQSEIRSLVREADVRVYAICIFDKSRALARIAEDSGGRVYRATKLNQLADLARQVSTELHSQYVLGYSPLNARDDGKYRKLSVKLARPLNAPGVRASWRRGYYAPGL